MYLLYSAALAVLLALSAPYWIVQALRRGKYRAGIGERLGRVPARLGAASGAIWVHAVSVGEVLAVATLVGEMRKAWPERRVLISTTTATGQKVAQQRFGEGNVFYFPLDFAFAVVPYLRRLRPELVVIAETEFWPNFLRLARQSGARIAVVNARISDRSFPRYRRWRGLMRPILDHISAFLAQSTGDRERLLAMGAPAERVQVSGNLKFDIKTPAPPPVVEKLRAALARAGAGPVMVFGSTVEGEEAIVLHAFQAVLEQFPRALLILAPRHPERFDAVAEMVRTAGLRLWRRSRFSGGEKDLSGGVFLLDTIGELAAVYALGRLALVGGSLVPRGGHNILEAAQQGCAIVVGPHTENFRDIVDLFKRAGAVRVVRDDELAAVLLDLLRDPRACESLGAIAAALVRDNAGATESTLRVLEQLLAPRAALTGAPR